MYTVTVVSDWIQCSLCSRHPMDPFIGEKGEEKEVLRGKKYVRGPSKRSSDSRNVSPYKMASVVTV